MSGAGRTPTVVIVEDDADSAAVLEECVRGLGYEVFATDRAESAIEHMARQPPGAVVCDIELAGRMNGYDLAREARRLPGGSGVLLLAITGHATPEHRAAAFEAGFDRILHKPFDLADLEAVLS